MKKEPTHTLEELTDKLDQAVETNGPYSHNIIGMVLSQVDRDYGVEAARKLFIDYKLEYFGFVCPH